MTHTDLGEDHFQAYKKVHLGRDLSVHHSPPQKAEGTWRTADARWVGVVSRSIILAFRRPRQEDHEFQAGLAYIISVIDKHSRNICRKKVKLHTHKLVLK